METWNIVDIRKKNEAQAIFSLIRLPFACCTSGSFFFLLYKRKFFFVPLLTKNKNGSYPFSNGLNGLNGLARL